MTREECIEFIRSTRGKIFAVRFVKRSTGELRTMNCRLGVHSHLKGGERAYDPKEKNLLVVYDMVAHGYRSVAIEGITEVEVKGTWVPVEG